MATLPELKCDVCGEPALGVASSCLGACSWAFCITCLRQRAEPLMMFVYTYDEVSSDGDNIADWVRTLYTFIDGQYVSWDDFAAKRKQEQADCPHNPEDITKDENATQCKCGKLL